MSNVEKVERIAKVCHEANRAFCATNGDFSHAEWEDAPEWQKDSAREGVRTALRNPNLTSEDMHIEWMKSKIDDGWTYGPTKDAEAKTHPCILPYDALDEADRAKDGLFMNIVRALDV